MNAQILRGSKQEIAESVALAEHRAGQAQREESCGAGGLNGIAGGERSAQEEGPRYGQ